MTSGTDVLRGNGQRRGLNHPQAYVNWFDLRHRDCYAGDNGIDDVVVTCTGRFVYNGSAADAVQRDGDACRRMSTESLTVVYTPQNTNVGTVTATASFGGDANNLPASNSTTSRSRRRRSTVTVSCPASVQYIYNGAAQTPCTATVTGAGGLNQSVTPTYLNNTNAGTATANATYSDCESFVGQRLGDLHHRAGNVNIDFDLPVDRGLYRRAQTPCTATA